MTEENKNINNKYLDIVDNSILGHGSIANDAIRSILQNKIDDEIESHRSDVAGLMFNRTEEPEEEMDEVEVYNDESEEGDQPDSEEEETEEETEEA